MKRQYTPDTDEEEMMDDVEYESCKKPRTLESSINDQEGFDWHMFGMGAAAMGNLEGVLRTLQHSKNFGCLYFIEAAAEGGHSHIIDYILQVNIHDEHLDNGIVQGAAKGGHLHIMELAIKMGGLVEYAMYGAAEAGNLQLFKQLEPRIPDYHDSPQIVHNICCDAARSGNLEFIKYLDETGKVDFLCEFDEDILDIATTSGSLDLVKYMMGYKLNNQLEIAASSGRRNILDYLLSTCIPSKKIITNIGVSAAYDNQKEIIAWAIQHGASKERILEASKKSDFNILSFDDQEEY